MAWSMLSPTQYRTSEAALEAGRVLGKLKKVSIYPQEEVENAFLENTDTNLHPCWIWMRRLPKGSQAKGVVGSHSIE